MFDIKGSQPECCISSMMYSGDIPFWSETLDIKQSINIQTHYTVKGFDTVSKTAVISRNNITFNFTLNFIVTSLKLCKKMKPRGLLSTDLDTTSHSQVNWMWYRMVQTNGVCKHNNNNNSNDCIQRRILRLFTFFSMCHELPPTHTLKWQGHNRVLIMHNTSSTYHVQHVPHAMRYEGTAHSY